MPLNRTETATLGNTLAASRSRRQDEDMGRRVVIPLGPLPPNKCQKMNHTKSCWHTREGKGQRRTHEGPWCRPACVRGRGLVLQLRVPTRWVDDPPSLLSFRLHGLLRCPYTQIPPAPELRGLFAFLIASNSLHRRPPLLHRLLHPRRPSPFLLRLNLPS